VGCDAVEDTVCYCVDALARVQKLSFWKEIERGEKMEG